MDIKGGVNMERIYWILDRIWWSIRHRGKHYSMPAMRRRIAIERQKHYHYMGERFDKAMAILDEEENDAR